MIRILYITSTKKISNFKDIIKYISSYQAIFHKITGFLKKNLNQTIKSIKMLFQGAILINISKEYTGFILIIKTR